MVKLHVGIDDTDSPRTGCTTYIAALLVEKLEKENVTFVEYPKLIRLNPNVPWKTRGNGAVSLTFLCQKDMIEKIKDIVTETVEKNSDIGYPGTDPGVVFLEGEVPEEIEVFARKAITGIVDKEQALKLVEKYGGEARFFEDERGVIGGLAAIGESLDGDHTYELIAYRTPENRGTVRKVDKDSVIAMDRAMHRETFNNFDYEKGRILITPHGPDPVLWGVRGESAEAVVKAHRMLKAYEPIERWVIFKTNQGTDAHLRRVKSISEVKPFHPVIVEGEVSENPKIIPRRHVVFKLSDGTGTIDCAAFEPTGTLRKVAARLQIGDLIEVMGGVKPRTDGKPETINLEKLRVIRLKPKVVFRNPDCPECGSRMESMGKGKGYRCRKCGFKSRSASKQTIIEERDLKPGLYITPPRSQRHLTKPIVRYGREKHDLKEKLIEVWHEP